MYDHRKCEDDEDATRMAEVILGALGYDHLQKGECKYSVKDRLSPEAFRKIAVYAERIARWARTESKRTV